MEDWNNDGKIDAEDEIYQELIIFDDTDFFNDDGRGAKRSPRSSHPASSKSPKKGADAFAAKFRMRLFFLLFGADCGRRFGFMRGVRAFRPASPERRKKSQNSSL